MGGGELEGVEAVLCLEADGDVLRAEDQDRGGTSATAEGYPDYAAVTDDPPYGRGEALAAE